MLILIGITCHWIDQSFVLHEALLDFKKLTGHHTGDYLAQEVFKALEKYNISAKLFCITTDNASNNGTLMTSLSQILYEEKGIMWDAAENHIACIDHVINIGIQALLKNIKVLKNNYSDAEEEVELVEEEAETFAGTMSKVRGITKVCLWCNVQTCFLTR